jgi:hypothetical protein
MAETASPEAAVPEKGEETPAAPSNDVDALVKELDRLLSKENLSSDPQISAALNPQLCVPVSTILQLKSVAAITDSLELVCEAADKSVNVGLSEDRTMVRPLLKSKRNTMIIRELEATEAEIRELLVGSPGEDEVVAVRPEVRVFFHRLVPSAEYFCSTSVAFIAVSICCPVEIDCDFTILDATFQFSTCLNRFILDLISNEAYKIDSPKLFLYPAKVQSFTNSLWVLVFGKNPILIWRGQVCQYP